MNAVERMLQQAIYDTFLERNEKYLPVGDKALNCYVRRECLQDLIYALQHDPRFYQDPWWRLHSNIGTHLISFRSYKKALDASDKRCMQIVVDQLTGKFYADWDLYNTQDLANIVAHLFVEVLPIPWTWKAKMRSNV
jgi:hypothetical protein